MKTQKLFPNKIDLWMPSIFHQTGGIQTYSTFLIKAIQNLYPKAKYNVFLKHDFVKSKDCEYLADTRFHFAGKSLLFTRTAFFAFQLIANAILLKPNLIISTHLNFTVAAYFVNKLFSIPYITIAHGVEAWNIQKPNLIKALNGADLVLAVSSYTRDRFIKELKISEKKIVVLSNTFDFNRFQIQSKPNYLLQKYSLNPKHKIVLTVSRLPKDDGCNKGYDKIIAALPKIRQAIPNVHYILVGKGDDKLRIEKLIKELNLKDNVTLAGFITDEQLCDYYNLCDVFAMPSKKEGFGIVFLEALACGKPTLAGNKDGSVDALIGGELGALVNPDNVDEIADTLTQILQGNYSHPLIYQPEKLRQKVIDNFGFEKFQATLAKHIEGILG